MFVQLQIPSCLLASFNARDVAEYSYTPLFARSFVTFVCLTLGSLITVLYGSCAVSVADITCVLSIVIIIAKLSAFLYLSISSLLRKDRVYESSIVRP